MASATWVASSRVGTRTSARGRAAVGAAAQALEQREREGGRLAGAGGGLAEQVAALQQRRDRLALDRRGLFVAERGQRGDQLVGEGQVREADGTVGRIKGHVGQQGIGDPREGV